MGNLYLKEVLWNISKAILFISILFLLESYIQKLWITHFDLIPDSIKKINSLIPKPKYPDDESFISEFVSLIASVSGVLLALFYPILATIASTAYSKVNSSIRNLLFIEPVTQNYLRKLAFLTAYAVCVLFLMALGFRPGNLILTILFFLGLFSLFNLLKLGAGVYNLFEPETLSKISNRLLIKNIKNVTIKAEYSDVPNFQKYFRVKAENKLNTLKLIHELSYSEINVNEKSFLETTEQVFYLLAYYLSVKPTIPIKSQWYKQRQYHKSYFETDTSERQLALNTRTYVLPKNESNIFWFENEILDNYNRIGKYLVEDSNREILQEYIKKSLFPLGLLGQEFEFDLAEKLINYNLELIKNSIDHSKSNSYVKSENNLMLAEGFIMSLRYFYDDYFKRVESLNRDNFNSEINKISWNKPSSIYESNMPSKLHKYLEDYSKYVMNEKKIYAKQITPIWYIEQHLSAEYLIIITEGFNKIVKHVTSLLYPLISECNKNENHLLCSFICHNIIELIDKLNHRLPSFLQAVKSFDENNLYKGQFKWASLEEEKIKDGFKSLSNQLLDVTANNFPKISKIEWNSDYPDVFAHSFSLVANGLNKSMINKDLKSFEKLITNFIQGGLDSFKVLFERYKGRYWDNFELVYQIHFELMQISGLSYIYSEITEVDFWSITIKAWDEYKVDENLINIIIMGSYSFLKYRKTGMGINFYDNFERQKDLRNFVQVEGINTANYTDNIIRRYINEGTYNKYDFEDIFIELYLLTFLESKVSATFLNEFGRRDFFNEISMTMERKYGNR